MSPPDAVQLSFKLSEWTLAYIIGDSTINAVIVLLLVFTFFLFICVVCAAVWLSDGLFWMIVNLLGGIHEWMQLLTSGVHGKSRTAALWSPVQGSAAITFTHSHVQSVLGEHTTSFTPIVPQEHWDYTHL